MAYNSSSYKRNYRHDIGKKIAPDPYPAVNPYSNNVANHRAGIVFYAKNHGLASRLAKTDLSSPAALTVSASPQ